MCGYWATLDILSSSPEPFIFIFYHMMMMMIMIMIIMMIMMMILFVMMIMMIIIVMIYNDFYDHTFNLSPDSFIFISYQDDDDIIASSPDPFLIQTRQSPKESGFRAALQMF